MPENYSALKLTKSKMPQFGITAGLFQDWCATYRRCWGSGKSGVGLVCTYSHCILILILILTNLIYDNKKGLIWPKHNFWDFFTTRKLLNGEYLCAFCPTLQHPTKDLLIKTAYAIKLVKNDLKKGTCSKNCLCSNQLSTGVEDRLSSGSSHRHHCRFFLSLHVSVLTIACCGWPEDDCFCFCSGCHPTDSQKGRRWAGRSFAGGPLVGAGAAQLALF